MTLQHTNNKLNSYLHTNSFETIHKRCTEKHIQKDTNRKLESSKTEEETHREAGGKHGHGYTHVNLKAHGHG